MTYTPSAAPESYLKLIKRGLTLYRTAFVHVFLFGLIASCIAFIPRFMSVLFNADVLLPSTPFDWRKSWLILVDLGTLLFITAMLWRMQCMMAGIRDSILSDFIVAFKKLPRIFVASAIQMLAISIVSGLAIFAYIFILMKAASLPLSNTARSFILIISILQFLLGFYIFYLFYFYLPLILIESKGIISAMKTSCLLVWRHLWQTFSVQVTPWLIYLFVIILIRNVLRIDLHIFFVEVGSLSAFSTCLNVVLFAVFLPWIAANILVQLHDLELRKAWQK